jgi:N-acylneuraminate cytidylyltransferase
MKINDIDAFIFDFDGVLTNNHVHIDMTGNELVTCSRSDGLAFDVLRKLKKPVYILSTESNKVVTARGSKLKVQVLQGVNDKLSALEKLSLDKGYDLNFICYVGNDLNDYKAMQHCGFRVCPADSHIDIKNIANIVLLSKGGDGAVRELIEIHFKINFLDLLY